MSVRTSQVASEVSDIQKIAQSMTAQEYFLSQEEKLLSEWSSKSVTLFRNAGEVLKSEYELRSSGVVDKYSQSYEQLYSQSRKEFEAYCILNRKVQKKGDEIENFAAFFNSRNHKLNFFTAWKAYADKNKFLRKMQERSEKYKQTRTLKTIMKAWLSMTMKSNRHKIKDQVLERTEMEISKIQGDYEKLINSLKETLEKKLLEMKKEEEEHKLIHDKYETMYSRARVESG